MLSELRVVLRRLWLRKTLSATLVATVAVGVGAATGTFSVVNATVLRPLPYPLSEDLHTLGTAYRDGRWSSGRVASVYVTALAESAPSITDVAAYRSAEDVVLAEDGERRQVLVQYVSEGFFDLFQTTAEVGRTFVSEDHGPGPSSAVLSHALWVDGFRADPGVVGRTVQMATGGFTVVGVAPADFDVPRSTDVWIGMELPQGGAGALGHTYNGYLRTHPGAADRLEGDLATVMGRLAAQYPETAGGRTFVTQPLLDAIVGDLSPILIVLFGGGLVILLLSSLNTATAMIARDAETMKDAAIKTALGADWRAVARGVLLEAGVVATAGTAAGLLLAWFGARALVVYGGEHLPRLTAVPLDGRVVLVAAGALIATLILTGVLPVSRLRRRNLNSVLMESGRSSTLSRRAHRLLSVLVVAELSFAIALLAVAGLLVRSYVNLAAVDAGFEPNGRLVFTAYLGGTRWAQAPALVPGPDGRPVIDPDSPPSPRTWLDAVTEVLTASRQVYSVGSANTLPLGRDWSTASYMAITGDDFDSTRPRTARIRGINSRFFESLGARLLAGRHFEATDGPSVAIVNQAFVREFLSGREPLDASFSYGFPVVNFANRISVVGVVEDIKYGSLREVAEPVVYVHSMGTRQAVVLSTSLDDPAPLIPFVRAALASVDPTMPVSVESLREMVAAQLTRHRAGLLVMLVFAGTSLLLSAVGVYGIISFVIEGRSREIATRTALGASPDRVRMFLVRQGAPLAVLGTVGGVGLAMLSARLAAQRLYEVDAFDPTLLSAAVGLVLAVATIGFVIPAERALRRSPTDVLNPG